MCRQHELQVSDIHKNIPRNEKESTETPKKETCARRSLALFCTFDISGLTSVYSPHTRCSVLHLFFPLHARVCLEPVVIFMQITTWARSAAAAGTAPIALLAHEGAGWERGTQHAAYRRPARQRVQASDCSDATTIGIRCKIL